MAIVKIEHGKTYRLGADDRAQFPFPLKDEKGDTTTKTDGRFTYRWVNTRNETKVAFFYDVPQFYPDLDGTNLYAAQDSVVTPEPEPEPPVVIPDPEPPIQQILAATNRGEAFIQNDYWSVGINPYAGLGSLYNAPPGFRVQGFTPTPSGPSGLYRLGMLSKHIPDVDLPMQGRAQEGPIWLINGVRAANIQLHGYYQVPGTFEDPFRWSGMKSGIGYKQKLVLEGETLRLLMTNTNETTAPIKLRFGRVFDPDTGMDFATTQKLLEEGLMQTTLSNGGRVLINAPGAKFYRTPYTGAQDFKGTLIPLGTAARKADDTLQAIWDEVTLAPGESITYMLEYKAFPKA